MTESVVLAIVALAQAAFFALLVVLVLAARARDQAQFGRGRVCRK